MRDVILQRKSEERRFRVGLEEAILRTTVSAIHGAAGNKKGARQAMRIKLMGDGEKVRASRGHVSNVGKRLGGGQAPAYSPEQIQEHRAKLEAQGKLQAAREARLAMVERGELDA